MYIFIYIYIYIDIHRSTYIYIYIHIQSHSLWCAAHLFLRSHVPRTEPHMHTPYGVVLAICFASLLSKACCLEAHAVTYP